MEKLIVHILPNWVDIPLKILVVIMTITFATFIFAAIKNNIKLGLVSQFIFIISLLTSFVIIFIIAIAGIMPDNPKSYTITKTNDTIMINSHSDWIATSTYNIIGHKYGIYYLENSERKDKVIKLPDKEFERIANQK